MKTIISILISLLVTASLLSQIEVLQIEKHNKKLDLVIPSPFIAAEFPVGLIYQDTSGDAFTNLSDRILRIADGPIGFQFQPNPVIFTEVTKNNFSINHFSNVPIGIHNLGPSRRGNWGPREHINPFYYDFHTMGNIYNIDFRSRRQAELTTDNGRGALRLYRYSGDFIFYSTLTINDAGNPTWTSVSDRSVKENITNVKDILPRLTQLQMKNYNYIGLEKSTRGYIAQEVQEIFPEMVSKTDDGLLAVDYLGFGTLAVQAIKEQQEIINSLEERMEKIEQLLADK